MQIEVVNIDIVVDKNFKDDLKSDDRIMDL